MGINQITRGQARAGVLIGAVRAAAGSIDSTELAGEVINSATLIDAGVVLSSILGAGAVTDGKRTKSVTAIAVAAAVGTAPSTSGAFLVTTAGATNVVVVGAAFDAPVAGDWFDIYGEIAAASSVISIEFKSTACKWNAAGDEVLKMSGPSTKGATEYHFQARALSSVRWVLINQSTGITSGATT